MAQITLFMLMAQQSTHAMMLSHKKNKCITTETTL